MAAHQEALEDLGHVMTTHEAHRLQKLEAKILQHLGVTYLVHTPDRSQARRCPSTDRRERPTSPCARPPSTSSVVIGVTGAPHHPLRAPRQHARAHTPQHLCGHSPPARAPHSDSLPPRRSVPAHRRTWSSRNTCGRRSPCAKSCRTTRAAPRPSTRSAR